MKRFKIVGLCLIAAFALSAVAASAASAAKPEFQGKVAKEFTSKGEAATLKVKEGITVKCAASTDVGKLNTGTPEGGAKKEGTVTVKFTKCLAAGVDACHSTSPLGGAEEIITKELAMTLGYIKKSTSEVGVDLSAATLAEFECAIGTGEKVAVTGSVIGKIEPLNKMTPLFNIKFEEASEKQVPEKFESKAADTLKSSINGGTPLASTEKTEDMITLTGGLEEEILG